MIRFNYLIGRSSPRQWSMLMVVCTAILQNIFSIGIWHVEGSMAELIEPPKAHEDHIVCKNCKVDPAHFSEEVSDVVGTFESKRIGELLDNIESIDHHQGDDGDGKRSGFLGRLKSAAMEPVSSYISLMKRFESWRKNYVKLQKEYGTREDGQPKLANPMDVLRSEYATVDKVLMNEACQRDSEKSMKEFENMDLIFKILEVLIDHLESQLKHLMEHGPPSNELVIDLESRKRQAKFEETINESMARAKRILSKSVRNKLKDEAIRIMTLSVVNAALQYAISFAEPNAEGMAGMYTALEPALIMSGTIDTSLIVSYLYDIRFRAMKEVTQRTITSLTRFCVGKDKRLEE